MTTLEESTEGRSKVNDSNYTESSPKYDEQSAAAASLSREIFHTKAEEGLQQIVSNSHEQQNLETESPQRAVLTDGSNVGKFTC